MRIKMNSMDKTEFGRNVIQVEEHLPSHEMFIEPEAHNSRNMF